MGDDYRLTYCNLDFDAGSVPGATQTCSIPIIDDELVEVIETIVVSSSSSDARAQFSDNTTIIIMDNDSKLSNNTKHCRYVECSLTVCF